MAEIQVIKDIDKLIKKAVDQFGKPDATIAMLKKDYMSLNLKDVNDVQTYDRIKESLSIISKYRIDAEKTKKIVKTGSNKYNKAVDKEFNRIKNLVEPIETHLKNEKQKRDDYLDEEKRKEEEKEILRLQEENRIKDEENARLREQLENAQKENSEAEDLFGGGKNETKTQFQPTPKNYGKVFETSVNSYDTLTKIVKQLESCNYIVPETGSPLILNVAFIALKRMAEKE